MKWEKMEVAKVNIGAGLFGTSSDISVLLSRAQVPGGWLVLAATDGGTAQPVSITFYPDPAHAWTLGVPGED